MAVGDVKGGATAGIKVAFTETVSYGGGSLVDLPEGFDLKSSYKEVGATLDKCNLIYGALLTFVASTPQTLNLKSLPNLKGVAAAVVFVRVRLMAILLQATDDAAYLDLGADGTANEWLGYLSPAGAKERIFPSTAGNSGFTIRQAPNTSGILVATDSRLLKMTPSAHAFTARLLLAGCNA